MVNVKLSIYLGYNLVPGLNIFTLIGNRTISVVYKPNSIYQRCVTGVEQRCVTGVEQRCVTGEQQRCVTGV
jgi:hypothetical protein